MSDSPLWLDSADYVIQVQQNNTNFAEAALVTRRLLDPIQSFDYYLQSFLWLKSLLPFGTW